MPITASTQHALRSALTIDPGLVQRALADAAGGDALALQALREKTGVTDAAQLKEAASLFASNKLHALLGVTGGNNAPIFAPTTGGIGAARTNAVLGMRGGRSMDTLAATLKSLASQRDGKIAERDQALKEKKTAEGSLAGMELGVRERWLGSWAGVLGGDSSKGEQGTALTEKVAKLDEHIQELDATIASFSGKMHDATAKQLLLDGDPAFKKLDEASKGARSALSAVKDFAELIEKAESAVSSAVLAEQMEMISEQHTRNANDNRVGTIDLSQINARWQISSAESLLAEVREAAPRVESQLRAWGKDADLGNIRTTDTGKSLDTMLDMLGLDNGSWFFGSDAMVLANLGSASGELATVGRRVDRVLSQVREQAHAASAARGQFIEALEARLLG